MRHLGDAAGVNLDRCGGRPQCLSETAFLQLNQPVYVVAEDKHPMTRIIARQSYIARTSTMQRVFHETKNVLNSATDG